MIHTFKNEFNWLSNFALVKIKLGKYTYPSVEHAYMSAKSKKKKWKKFCSNINNRPGLVKQKSRYIKLIKNWDTKKLSIMKICVFQKFSQEPYKTKLIQTGNQNIQEGNYWNDTFWGINLKTGMGENNLGRILMDTRALLLNK